MRSLILVLVISLAVASVLSKKAGAGKGGKEGKGGKGGKGEKGEKEEGNGLCLTKEHMMMMCSAGSSLGERTMAAKETCFGNAVAEERAKKGKGKGKKPKPNKPNKGKGKGKGKDKCPPVDDIEEWAMEKYAGEICVFQELGWMDSDMNEMEEVIQADIDTLPTDIADALKGDPYAECLAMAEKKMESMAKKYNCEGKYDEEEKARLDELFTGIAETECFMYVFKESCGSYVKKNLSTILGGLMPAAGRK